MQNQSGNRGKKITGAGKSVGRRGSGLGTGPVGSAGGYQGRPGTGSKPQQSQAPREKEPRQSGAYGRKFGQTQQYGQQFGQTQQYSQQSGQNNVPFGVGGGGGGVFNPDSASTGARRSGGGLKRLLIIAVVVIIGFFVLRSLFGGGGSGELDGGYQPPAATAYQPPVVTQQPQSPSGGSVFGGGGGFGGFFNSANTSMYSSGWDRTSNVGTLDQSVAAGARKKYTRILGSGRDVVTVMVYMCGTDLESRSGMATNDLVEMTKATIGDNLNLIVYTGGCTGWKNDIVSARVNQIYQVKSGGVTCLVQDAGTAAMTDPKTLTSFIDYCEKNFPANRNELILWDHGGGTLSGYGYDEKNKSSGSMTLPSLARALSDAGMQFDFIGFDACLMATLETALTVEPYADYLIASEETEPGIGWYYTNWLTAFSNNTSMATLDVGKNIVDDFVATCGTQCRGQKTTLSVTDLAELSATVPDALRGFSQDTVELLKSNDYQMVSNARSGAREFASSNKIDQIDLVHLATKLGTQEAETLARALLGAVKYNKTSSEMTNAYGLSIYFPYQKVSSVNQAVSTYDAIGMDEDYAACIRQFASMEVGGQAVSGGAASPLGTLLGGSGYSAGTTAAGGMGADAISQLLSGLLGGNMMNVAGMTSGSGSFMDGFLDVDRASSYLADNSFDASALTWSASDGTPFIALTPEQWALIQKLELNVFLDDGEGFIDLGLDNYYEFTDDGCLLGTYDGTWLALDDQPVAYYFMDNYEEGGEFLTTGRIPVLLNGQRAELIVVFDTDHPDGYIAGARAVYADGETETVAKGMTELSEGDVIEPLCDFYRYDGTYEDSYLLGDPLTWHEDMQISYVYIDAGAASACYRLTDMYNQQYWTPEMAIAG